MFSTGPHFNNETIVLRIVLTLLPFGFSCYSFATLIILSNGKLYEEEEEEEEEKEETFANHMTCSSSLPIHLASFKGRVGVFDAVPCSSRAKIRQYKHYLPILNIFPNFLPT